MAFVRLLKDLLKDPEIGPRIVPIIPDEARTFGMDAMFPVQKIYNPHGQTYLSVDRELMLATRRPPTASSCTRASTRPAPPRRSSPPARRTPRTASR